MHGSDSLAPTSASTEEPEELYQTLEEKEVVSTLVYKKNRGALAIFVLQEEARSYNLWLVNLFWS